MCGEVKKTHLENTVADDAPLKDGLREIAAKKAVANNLHVLEMQSRHVEFAHYLKTLEKSRETSRRYRIARWGAGSEHTPWYRDNRTACKKTVARRLSIIYHARMAECFKCGAPLPKRERIFRTTRCESCGADVKVCRNCVFYTPGLHWDCRETIPEAVKEKDRANFCEYFVPGGSGAEDPREQEQESARDQFNNLFGNG